MQRYLFLCAAFLLFAGCDPLPSPTPAPAASTRPVPQTQAPAQPDAVVEDDRDNRRVVTIYYRHPRLEGLVPRQKRILVGNPVDEVKQVIDHLSIRPKDGYGLPIWPDSTFVREIFLLGDGTVVVDFDGEFVASLSAGSTREEFLVYSLVNSLVENFNGYDKVRILVDGQVGETFLGHIDIENALGRRYSVYRIEPEFKEDDHIQVEELETL